MPAAPPEPPPRIPQDLLGRVADRRVRDLLLLFSVTLAPRRRALYFPG